MLCLLGEGLGSPSRPSLTPGALTVAVSVCATTSHRLCGVWRLGFFLFSGSRWHHPTSFPQDSRWHSLTSRYSSRPPMAPMLASESTSLDGPASWIKETEAPSWGEQSGPLTHPLTPLRPHRLSVGSGVCGTLRLIPSWPAPWSGVSPKRRR